MASARGTACSSHNSKYNNNKLRRILGVCASNCKVEFQISFRKLALLLLTSSSHDKLSDLYSIPPSSTLVQLVRDSFRCHRLNAYTEQERHDPQKLFDRDSNELKEGRAKLKQEKSNRLEDERTKLIHNKHNDNNRKELR